MNTETLINQFTINPYVAIQLMVEKALILEGKTADGDTKSFRYFRDTFQKSVAGNPEFSTGWISTTFEAILCRSFRLIESKPEKKVWDFERSSRYLGPVSDGYIAIDLPPGVPPNRKFKVHLEVIPD